MAIEIYTLEDLNNIRNDLSGDYILMNDIDASETREWNWNAEREVYEGFEPIGIGSSFTGTFDGQFFVIKNLYINRDTSYNGLFSKINGIVTKTGLLNVDITGSSYCGGFCGEFLGNLSLCFVTGVIKATAIKTSQAGGVVGTVIGTLSNCYSLAEIYAQDLLGSFCASLSSGTISNCYSCGKVVGGTRIGGFCGQGRGNYTVTSSYWDTQTSEQATSVGGTGKLTSEMKDIETYIDWDFEEIWGINPGINEGYPYLRGFHPIQEKVIYIGEGERILLIGKGGNLTIK